MGKILVDIKIWNIRDEYLASAGVISKDKIKIREIRGALVDTGATKLILPRWLADELDFTVFKETYVTYADGRKAKKGMVQGVMLEVLNPNRRGVFSAIVEENGTNVLLGQIVLEDLDLYIDPVKGCLRGRPESPDEPVYEIYLICPKE